MAPPGNFALRAERAAAAKGWLRDTAFVVGDRAFTHGEVHDGGARMAALLAGLGVTLGDRVLLVAPDGMGFVWTFLGALRLGAVIIPVNSRLTRDDHRGILGHCGARVVVASADAVGHFDDAVTVVEDDLTEVLAGQALHHPGVEVADDDPAYAQYTSGTTGAPKAAVHRHRDPDVYFEAFARPAARIKQHDVLLSASKMFFAYGLGNSLFFTILSGCRAVLHREAPRPDVVAALVAQHGVTVLFGVPTFYAHLVSVAGTRAMPTVRVAVCAGEPLTVVLAERVRRCLGFPILDGLGSTEVGQTFVSNTLDLQRDGTVGRALPPYEVAVRGDDGRPLGHGDVGTLWVRGPTVMAEYLGAPEATAAVIDGDWLKTGDRACVDPDGFVRLEGRIDDIEIVGGVNVAPSEIEAVLADHEAVVEVAVASVRDGLGASRLEAFVVAAPGAPPADELATELLARAGERLAPHKVPRDVRFVDALPRTATGKLRRFVLRGG
ncbi:MAG TPA: AMP-binding protein [Acidimicrobiales bacterium]